MSWKSRLLPAVALILASVATALPAAAQSGPPASHKSVGIAMQGDDKGILVIEIRKDSPAEKAGVKVGDQVISVAGISILELDPPKLTALADTAQSLAFVVVRDGQKMSFDIVPAYPPQAPAPSGGAPR